MKYFINEFIIDPIKEAPFIVATLFVLLLLVFCGLSGFIVSAIVMNFIAHPGMAFLWLTLIGVPVTIASLVRKFL